MSIREIRPRDRKAWRAWLERNHEKESAVWLVRYKRHTGKPSPSTQEAMDEAICFGWIDTTAKRLDDDRWAQCFRKRTENARWSENTLKYAKRLLGEGRMTPAGMRAYELGKERTPHDQGIPKAPDMPDELKKALDGANAMAKWGSLAPSYRRTFLRWLFRAKRPETRRKRIEQIVGHAKAGTRLGSSASKSE